MSYEIKFKNKKMITYTQELDPCCLDSFLLCKLLFWKGEEEKIMLLLLKNLFTPLGKGEVNMGIWW